MTDLNITLSGSLQAQLGQSGAWAYAVYFDSSGAPHWTSLVNNGTIQSSGTASISLPASFIGGKVYFLVQSQAPSDPNDLQSLITQQSDINWQNATNYDFRYDSFEVTLSSATGDVGNLTSVNGFGLPMELSVPYDNGTTATAGYAISAATLVNDIKDINNTQTYAYDYTSGPLSGTFRIAVSPTESVTLNAVEPPPSPLYPFQNSDWSGYVTGLEGAIAQGITVSGNFNGAPDAGNIWHNGGYFAYQLQWDASDSAFWLVPLASSQIQGDIRITPANLEDSIYSTLGTVDIYSNKTDALPYLPGMNTGANNQWGKVLSEFLTGFTAGFYSTTGMSLNPQAPGTVDLDQNINWDPTYAFDQNLSGSPPSYVTSDPYSKIFYDNSNSYGSGYSDALMSQYAQGGPQVPVVEPGTATDVPNIDLTLFADSETPTGYTTPEIHNYIAPAAGGYIVPGVSTNNVVLDFASAVADNAGVVPDKTDSITLGILTSDAGNTPVFNTVTLDGNAAGSNGLWQNWVITYDSTTAAYQATPSSPTVAQPVGSILLEDFPTAASGVSWYQIGAGGKTFDLYTTSIGGQFANPAYSGQQGALAIDGLAGITTPAITNQTIDTFTINFASGDSVAIDPSELQANTASGANLANFPDAPVAGTLSGNTFAALPGQTSQTSNVITTSKTAVAFGWTGENNDPSTSSWISGYTNKIDADSIARVTIAPSVGSAFTTTATADIDGKWQTGTVDLNPGTYTVTMAEYLPTDTAHHPLTNQSHALILTETACFVAGTPIRTLAGDVPVEALTVGTVVPTANGRGTANVIWVGHRAVDCRRHPRPRDVSPIRIHRHALGFDRPAADLLLSPDHAVFLDDVLIPVKYLVNGTTIRRESAALITYYHVELDRHDIILAAGLPVESFLDTGGRAAFVNGGPAIQLHPDFALWTWEAKGCAPLVVSGPKLRRVRAIVDAMAEMAAPGRQDRRARSRPLGLNPMAA